MSRTPKATAPEKNTISYAIDAGGHAYPKGVAPAARTIFDHHLANRPYDQAIEIVQAVVELLISTQDTPRLTLIKRYADHWVERAGGKEQKRGKAEG